MDFCSNSSFLSAYEVLCVPLKCTIQCTFQLGMKRSFQRPDPRKRRSVFSAFSTLPLLRPDSKLLFFVCQEKAFELAEWHPFWKEPSKKTFNEHRTKRKHHVLILKGKSQPLHLKQNSKQLILQIWRFLLNSVEAL